MHLYQSRYAAVHWKTEKQIKLFCKTETKTDLRIVSKALPRAEQ